MSIVIQTYQPHDLVSIVEIINYNIQNTTSLYDYNLRTIEQQEQIFQDKLDKGFPIITAKIDEKIVGFGYYSEFRTRDAYQYTVEHSVYVDHHFHHKDIGSALLDKLIELAQFQNKHVMVGVIDSKNKNSIDFHVKKGFEIVGEMKQIGFKFNHWLDTTFVQKIINK
ncbi:GNAT family N-acetyltransferase [Flavobacterium croceum]|uniref:GNAT family N-acetyltransferase n=1 Tax=Flavobacterium croceum TaxID=370975 RepID=UPI0024A93061|nr:GNAT family N-acetyltransferase [Flavobacterium croceum]